MSTEEPISTYISCEVKVAQSCPTLCDPMDCSPWNPPGQKTEVGSPSLLQGIFPTQGSNPGLQHCRWILSQLSYQGSPGAIMVPHKQDFLKETLLTNIFEKEIPTLEQQNLPGNCFRELRGHTIHAPGFEAGELSLVVAGRGERWSLGLPIRAYLTAYPPPSGLSQGMFSAQLASRFLGFGFVVI